MQRVPGVDMLTLNRESSSLHRDYFGFSDFRGVEKVGEKLGVDGGGHENDTKIFVGGNHFTENDEYKVSLK